MKTIKTRVFTLLTLTIATCLTFAQKTKVINVRQELSQARAILKSGKNVEQAEKMMTSLLKDSANRDNKKVYATWFEAVHMQYEAINEKLYIKQRQDTTQFYSLTKRMFDIATTLDSIDMRPDKKGKVAPEYRRDNARQLMTYRPNLLYATTYFVRKGDYQKAFEYGEEYIDCARQPLFSDYKLDSTDTRIAEAAYWTTYSAYRMKDAVKTLRYRNLALADTTKLQFTLQYIAEARRWLNDDSLYVETLTKGFDLFPKNPYFFPLLLDYHTSHDNNQRALQIVNHALEANDSSQLTLYAKATILFNLEKYDESIQVTNALLERNDSMPDAYYNLGGCYMNKALTPEAKCNKKCQRQLYQQARQAMERYRQLAPDQKQKWGPALYRIYLNLNMGRQFDEIDRLLRPSA